MLLSEYQRKILREVRADQQTDGLEFLTLTGSGFASFDAYRKQTYVETSSFFSGAVVWNAYVNKKDTEGGYSKASDITVVASREYKDKAEEKDVKLRFKGIKFRVSKIIDCEDSGEIVVEATRLE